MYRELEEEIGLRRTQVRVLGRTREWLRYEVPERWARHAREQSGDTGPNSNPQSGRGGYRRQKQIWLLLRMLGRDCDVSLRASPHPEFDAWRPHHYWVPLETPIDFKREAYRQARLHAPRFL